MSDRFKVAPQWAPETFDRPPHTSLNSGQG